MASSFFVHLKIIAFTDFYLDLHNTSLNVSELSEQINKDTTPNFCLPVPFNIIQATVRIKKKHRNLSMVILELKPDHITADVQLQN